MSGGGGSDDFERIRLLAESLAEERELLAKENSELHGKNFELGKKCLALHDEALQAIKDRENLEDQLELARAHIRTLESLELEVAPRVAVGTPGAGSPLHPGNASFSSPHPAGGGGAGAAAAAPSFQDRQARERDRNQIRVLEEKVRMLESRLFAHEREARQVEETLNSSMDREDAQAQVIIGLKSELLASHREQSKVVAQWREAVAERERLMCEVQVERERREREREVDKDIIRDLRRQVRAMEDERLDARLRDDLERADNPPGAPLVDPGAGEALSLEGDDDNAAVRREVDAALQKSRRVLDKTMEDLLAAQSSMGRLRMEDLSAPAAGPSKELLAKCNKVLNELCTQVDMISHSRLIAEPFLAGVLEPLRARVANREFSDAAAFSEALSGAWQAALGQECLRGSETSRQDVLQLMASTEIIVSETFDPAVLAAPPPGMDAKTMYRRMHRVLDQVCAATATGEALEGEADHHHLQQRLLAEPFLGRLKAVREKVMAKKFASVGDLEDAMSLLWHEAVASSKDNQDRRRDALRLLSVTNAAIAEQFCGSASASASTIGAGVGTGADTGAGIGAGTGAGAGAGGTSLDTTSDRWVFELLADAADAIRQMDPDEVRMLSDLEEHSVPRPVRSAVGAMAALIGEPGASWDTCRQLLSRPEELVERLLAFDRFSVSEEAVAQVQPLMDDDRDGAMIAGVGENSDPAGAMWLWSKSIVSFHDHLARARGESDTSPLEQSQDAEDRYHRLLAISGEVGDDDPVGLLHANGKIARELERRFLEIRSELENSELRLLNAIYPGKNQFTLLSMSTSKIDRALQLARTCIADHADLFQEEHSLLREIALSLKENAELRKTVNTLAQNGISEVAHKEMESRDAGVLQGDRTRPGSQPAQQQPAAAAASSPVISKPAEVPGVRKPKKKN
jgi:hypothetical protein